MNLETAIVEILRVHQHLSRKEITEKIENAKSESTIKRALSLAVERNLLIATGKGPSTKYSLSPQAEITFPIDVDKYSLLEVDQRHVRTSFNFDLIRQTLPNVTIFTAEEMKKLTVAQEKFVSRLDGITEHEYKSEMERLAIDLSWKSSQIEGNTYSLLETERLLKEKKEATGKKREEAIMLLNHKDALDFLLENTDYLLELNAEKIIKLNSILIQDLDVDRNIRNRRVGITGTNYRPIDNEFQIREAMEDTCQLINSRENIFEKALLCVLLLSYIQAFVDGNKRTARLTSNGILMANRYCPLSFRTVESIDYKKAMLLFYEQNNLSAFKEIFISQFLFAVDNYF